MIDRYISKILFLFFNLHVARYYWSERFSGDALRMSSWFATVCPIFRMALSSPLQHLSAVTSAHGNTTTATAKAPRAAARWRPWAVHAAASDIQVGGYEEGNLVRPRWTGETPLSRLVRALISFKPLYSVLKLGARQVLIRSGQLLV